MPGEWCATTCNKRYPSEVSETRSKLASIERANEASAASIFALQFFGCCLKCISF